MLSQVVLPQMIIPDEDFIMHTVVAGGPLKVGFLNFILLASPCKKII